MERAHEVYKELAKSDADAGYAVDEITGLLGKIPADGFAVLSADGLAGWTAVAVNPAEAKTLPARQAAKLRKAADEAVAAIGDLRTACSICRQGSRDDRD